MRNSRPVLLVEDDTIDALTVKRAFRELGLTCPLVHHLGGEDAVAHLTKAEHKLPCIILLDLNMPRMNGIEFLQIIKKDACLKMIPVVVLTTSHEERDVRETFRLGAAGYIVKPVDYREFLVAMRTVALYWLLSELPADRTGNQCPACICSSTDTH